VKALALAAALAALALAGLAGPAAGATPAKRANPYRTDHQAAAYLNRTRRETGWYCLNGYYSRREQRTHRHPAGYMRLNAQQRFLSFTCVGPGPDLYLLTRPAGVPWVVVRDR
jgi:hypothetical protein